MSLPVPNYDHTPVPDMSIAELKSLGIIWQGCRQGAQPEVAAAAAMLRSKGLKDATCVGWFGDDWDCSVGSPPEAMDHVSSAVPIGYAV